MTLFSCAYAIASATASTFGNSATRWAAVFAAAIASSNERPVTYGIT